MSKKIFWLTAGYFLDVDIPVVPELMSDFDIDWIILTNRQNLEDDRNYIVSKTNCRFEIIADQGKFFSMSHYRILKDIVKQAALKEYDIYYFDISDFIFLFPLVGKYIPKEKVIIATHNVNVPKGARLAFLAKFSMNYILRNFNNFQTFSLGQRNILLKRRPDANVLYAPLMLKDYGGAASHPVKYEKPVKFLFFGNIVRYKRLDVLLKAVEILQKRGIKDFKIYICGYCQQEIWNKDYLPMIGDSSKYFLDIRRIPNDKVAEYFLQCHYFVMPYQDIAQSGAMTVALNYNMPIIASDLPTFREFLTGKGDSYFFAPADPEALADKMEGAIKNTPEQYRDMKKCLHDTVEKNLSSRSIIEKYKRYLDNFGAPINSVD